MMTHIRTISHMLDSGRDSMDVMGYINNNPDARKKLSGMLNKQILLNLCKANPAAAISQVRNFTGLSLGSATTLYNCIRELENFIRGL